MKWLLLCLSCLMLLAATPAWADVSRDDAAAAAQRQTGGRVLSVDRSERDGRPVWRVKVVTEQGEVKVVFIDAASGRAI
ncbi:Peptidase propeptide and YPEB domain-containing protein [Chitinimonas taiwanensis DSM 18899]|uniref:Peptidase propeptide and YPEB domain-containing protein n=2 Tax=Chitinimonas TaxID=240411 RepID=A0A1K2HML2_9NEIS|nr:Peptidase propeptide and YPEB domain-containing protein [Chitinimonas taiwanensis DSM 18899]